MGIYIKGIKMPVFEHQSWDIRKGTDEKWYIVDTNAETSDGEWYEIILVPPHGRLIDADELDKIWGLIGHDDLENAPTIILAEESNMDSFIRIFEEDDEEDGMDSFIRILKD